LHVKEVLERLWLLQQTDTEIRELARSSEELSAGTRSALAAVEKAKANVDAAHVRVKEALSVQHRHELELKQREDEINKAKLGLNSASNNKEYQGLLLRIGTLEAECGKVEEKILLAMETREERERDERAARELQKTAEAGLRAAEARVAAERDGIEKRVQETASRRGNIASEVPAESLRLYERIRGGNRSTGTAVTVVYGEYCQGCQMQVTPQQMTDLIGGTTLVICRTCQRILALGE
jgi:predicted  nucleic acid-binding Zn-ribbon protein